MNGEHHYSYVLMQTNIDFGCPAQFDWLRKAGAIEIRLRGKNRLGANILEGLFTCSDCGKQRWITGRSASVASGEVITKGRDCGCGGKKGINQLRAGGFIGKVGPENLNWKGGRSIRSDGYVLVQLPPDDPFAKMGRCKGGGWYQVFEHRLVMAKFLGRCLSSKEQVHHKDGDTSNNVIKNLQLFASRAEHTAFEQKLLRDKLQNLEEQVKSLTEENERLRYAIQNQISG